MRRGTEGAGHKTLQANRVSTPEKVHAGIAIAGIACVIVGSMIPHGFALMFVWMIFANLIAHALKCERCGKRLTTTK